MNFLCITLGLGVNFVMLFLWYEILSQFYTIKITNVNPMLRKPSVFSYHRNDDTIE